MAFGVICHPHPLYGGTLDNKVVYTLARVFQEFGAATIRFNFRGVGASEGEFNNGIGETDDVLAVIEYGRKRWPGTPLWLGGFSFGGAVALRAASVAKPQRLVAAAPAISRVDLSGSALPDYPWLIVQGDADDVVSPREVIDWANGLAYRPRLTLLPGVGHFFHGELNALRGAVADYLAQQKPG